MVILIITSVIYNKKLKFVLINGSINFGYVLGQIIYRFSDSFAFYLQPLFFHYFIMDSPMENLGFPQDEDSAPQDLTAPQEMKQMTYRVSTGLNHVACKIVFEEIKGLIPLDARTHDLFTRLICDLIVLADRFNNAVSKKKKEEIRRSMETAITRWNKTVNKNRKFADWIKLLPTINTKVHHYHGHVKDLPLDYDDFALDGNGRQCVLCSHQHGRHNSPCWVVPQSSLEDWFVNIFSEIDHWTLTGDIDFTKRVLFDKGFFLKRLCIKCPVKKTAFCKLSPIDDGICGYSISIGKILQFMTKQGKEKYTDEKIRCLFFNVLARDHPTQVTFCPNIQCKHSSECFQFNVLRMMPPRDHDLIFCSFCKEKHHVHAHKQVCPDRKCGTTFCKVCKVSPYHDRQICQGPPSTIDADIETQNHILKITRPCPSCNQRMEKNDGCDHMICKGCGNDWCWRCIQSLTKNDPYMHTCISSDLLDGEPSQAYRDFDDF